MATPAPGILQRLLEAMHAGTAKPVGEHRSALLQVTDIVPVNLDEKDLWPRHGFYIKVSDSSHSIYASLPFDQDDLVLSNKVQLGQFIQVDRLEPGSPVPILRGAKPIPGRHPLMGTPEPIVRSRAKVAGVAGVRRGSWGQEQGVSLDFEEGRTPVKQGCSPVGVARGFKSSPYPSSSSSRKSGGELQAEEEGGGGKGLRSKSCVGSAKFPRSKSVSRVPKSPFSTEKVSSTPTRTRETPVVDEPESKEKPAKSLFAAYQSLSESTKNGNSQHRISLPGRLSLLGKEVMQQRDEAQKVALQALRDASATETLVRMLKSFSDLTTKSKPDSPSSCFEQFLTFDQEISQVVSDMEKIQSATSIPAAMLEEDKEEQHSILHEINHNSTRRRVLSKSVSFMPDLKSLPKQNPNPKPSEERKQTVLSSSIRMARQIQSEAGNWFMGFLEKALELGLKKHRCSQSVLLKIINWVEVEQGDGSKRSSAHPRAGQIARKLRIKMKNP